MHQKPSTAPSCWGSKYQDGDPECRQCRYSDSCKLTMLNKLSQPPSHSTSLPVIRQLPPPTPSLALPVPPVPTPSQVMVPLPTKPYLAPPVAAIPLPKQTVPLPTPSPQPNYYSTTSSYSLPDPMNPSPIVPLQRPGTTGGVHYFTQYPGESVGVRIGKNILLRALEAIFYELMNFFRHWTWPPLTTR